MKTMDKDFSKYYGFKVRDMIISIKVNSLTNIENKGIDMHLSIPFQVLYLQFHIIFRLLEIQPNKLSID